ncbi:hypothetical protein Cni_G22402 [Canna indica]|uniref:Uncharacterized protein n=1 Tax=Canna indica TaxID=4628 RepID=A0AAQ3KRS6_9LILI|nr:hypothetical protein Cni_G22402 [Canna indica]
MRDEQGMFFPADPLRVFEETNRYQRGPCRGEFINRRPETILATYTKLVTQRGGDPAQHQLDADTWMHMTGVDHDRIYGIGTMAHTQALLQPHGMGSPAFTSCIAGPSTSRAD